MLHQFMEGHDAVDREVAAHRVKERKPSLEDVFCPRCGNKTLLKGSDWVPKKYDSIKCGTCGATPSKSDLDLEHTSTDRGGSQ